VFVDIVRDADQKTLAKTNEWLRALAGSTEENNAQWRTFKTLIGKLPHWLSTLLIRMPLFSPKLWVKYRGGAVLVSSPAKYGVDSVAATWSSPLGVSFGMVKQRPVVRNGQVTVRPTFFFVLNFDRRIMAGAQAAKFFKRITDLLENAEKEICETPPPKAGEKENQAAAALASTTTNSR
jgi:hypothetical protein